MNKLLRIGILVFIFLGISTLFGIISGIALNNNIADYVIELKIQKSKTNMQPSNWIDDNEIHVYKSGVIIKKEDILRGRVKGTGSMLPLINKNCTLLYYVPKSKNDIKIGDIIVFEKGNFLNKKDIVHRVVNKTNEYFYAKGDNGNKIDKIKYNDIQYVVVGILY